MSFRLAIVGRPNVGKSTLFNRLAGSRLALVDDTPGVTRDRRAHAARLQDLRFEVIDTAGLEDATDDSLQGRMRRLTERAVAMADVCLFVIDARAGVTPTDEIFADILRKRSGHVILAANKAEGAAAEPGVYEAFGLGLGDPVQISAEHGEGMNDLYARLMPLADGFEARAEAEAPETDVALPEDDDPDAEALPAYAAPTPERPLQVAVVGRPNAGKSTLINTILGEERLLTGPEAGITRDAIATKWTWQGREIRLVDTAGLRRQARVQEKLEHLAVNDTFRAIQYAQVVVLVLDAEQPLEKQDLTIARKVVDEGRALVIAVNKWDSVQNRTETMALIKDRLQTSLQQIRGVRVVTMSALTGKGVDKLLPTVFEIFDLWNTRVPTGALNRWLSAMLEAHPPPMGSHGKRLTIRYATQAKTRPPTFYLFSSTAGKLPDSYLRYLANGLRDDFGLDGIPIRIHTRSGKNPYA